MKKVVLITGCSSGFGKALAKAYAKKDYYVIATARNIKKIDDIDVDLKVALDVTDNTSIDNAIKEIANFTDKIDILVNNAGYSVRSAVEEIDMQALRSMYEVNVFGIIHMTQAILPIMRKNGSGKILNVGSISGRMVGLVNGGYCSTKYAVEAITEATRYEVKDKNIDVCVIEPGAMDTSFFDTLSKNSDAKMLNSSSPYKEIYDRDLSFRKKQSKSDVDECAEKIVRLTSRKKLKIRYTVGVSTIYKLFVRFPDCVKEKLILKFN